MAQHGTQPQSRTPWQVTRSVWYAMFMREAVSRTMADRFGWFWMIFEPVAYTGIMIAVRSFIRSDRLIVGADFIPWMITGLMGFFLFREGMMRSIGAVDANQGLFAYRQVKPVDPVLVRVFLEGMLRSFVFVLFIAGGLMLGLDLFPDFAVLAMFSWLSLWVLGAGAGLVVSAVSSLVPEVGRLVRMVSLPLMIVSGAFIPLHVLPHWLLHYMLYNPLVHGLEYLRRGFFDGYKVLSGIDLTYMWLWALGLVAFGLMLHIHYADRLKAK